MILHYLAFIAGVITMLSPCTIPILPIILSGVLGGRCRPAGIVVGFSVSFILFTVLTTYITNNIFGIKLESLKIVSSIILILLGINLLTKSIDKYLEKNLSFNFLFPFKKTDCFWNGILSGAPLGLLWAPCIAPLFAVIITLSLRSESLLFAISLSSAYTAGMVLIMILVLGTGRYLLIKENKKNLIKYGDILRKVFGVCIILIGIVYLFNLANNIQLIILKYLPPSWVDFIYGLQPQLSIEEVQEILNY